MRTDPELYLERCMHEIAASSALGRKEELPHKETCAGGLQPYSLTYGNRWHRKGLIWGVDSAKECDEGSC